MKQSKIVPILLQLLLFCFLLTLVVLGQKNLGPVIWMAELLGTKNIRMVGVCVMIIAIFGMLGQLNSYNRKYRV